MPQPVRRLRTGWRVCTRSSIEPPRGNFACGWRAGVSIETCGCFFDALRRCLSSWCVFVAGSRRRLLFICGTVMRRHHHDTPQRAGDVRRLIFFLHCVAVPIRGLARRRRAPCGSVSLFFLLCLFPVRCRNSNSSAVATSITCPTVRSTKCIQYMSKNVCTGRQAARPEKPVKRIVRHPHCRYSTACGP